MKRIFIAVFVILAALNSLIAQTEWELIFHSTYIPTLEQEMGEMVDAGYEPVGIEYVMDGVKKGILTMYEKVEEPSIQGMKIIEVFDESTLVETITDESQDGYLPMDLTWVEKSYLLLFVKYADSPITQWSLDTSEASYEGIGKNIEKYVNVSRQWIPVGITGHEKTEKYRIMYLFVPGLELQDYNVYTFDSLENFQLGVDQLYAEGWSMCGFSIYGQEWDVVVVKSTYDANKNSIDIVQSSYNWEGNWGDGSLVIKNVTDKSFDFKFEVVSSRGHSGSIDNGTAIFSSLGAYFVDPAYPNYMIFFIFKDNHIYVKEMDLKTGKETLESPFCGAGISFSGSYPK